MGCTFTLDSQPDTFFQYSDTYGLMSFGYNSWSGFAFNKVVSQGGDTVSAISVTSTVTPSGPFPPIESAKGKVIRRRNILQESVSRGEM